jgi:broad specificity phosphatase PhoE
MNAPAIPILYVMRHGETEDNLKSTITAQADSALTARGRDQASAKGTLLKQHIADLRTLYFVASPLHRACVTMELARAAAGLDPPLYATDPRLMEMDFGEWTKWREGDDKFHPDGPTAHQDWHLCPPGGESQSMVYERVGSFLRTLAQDTVLVCHARIVCMIEGYISRLSPEETMRLKPPNAGMLILTDRKGVWLGD